MSLPQQSGPPPPLEGLRFPKLKSGHPVEDRSRSHVSSWIDSFASHKLILVSEEIKELSQQVAAQSTIVFGLES